MTVGAGKSFPLGASMQPGGVNFSLYSEHAGAVRLLLFDRVDDARAARTIELDARRHRTYHYWHVLVPEIGAGQIYGWRVDGPKRPDLGLRFDPDKVLLDPYGRAVALPPAYDRGAAARPGDNAAVAAKSVVVDSAAYDWEGDQPLYRPFGRSVIYEMHVRGFTRHPSSGVSEARRGTYAGLIEKIPYLVDLGITAVELLPVFQYDPHDAPAGRANYWGYAPISFFAPHAGYSAATGPAVRCSTSSATWSRRCTAPASRSSSMWSTTTPPRATSTGRPCAFAASTTRSTTSSSRTGRATPTTAAPATR